MPTQLTTAQHLAGLSEAMRAFVRYADRAGLEAPVPTCPDWTVLDLVAHQGMVHRWAGALVRGEQPSDEEVDGYEESGRTVADPLAWLSDGAVELARSVTAAPDDLATLVFLNDAPRPVPSGLAGSATRPRSTRSTRWPRPSAGPHGPTRSGSTPCSPATASTSCWAGS